MKAEAGLNERREIARRDSKSEGGMVARKDKQEKEGRLWMDNRLVTFLYINTWIV